jgi:hypothetical protein
MDAGKCAQNSLMDGSYYNFFPAIGAFFLRKMLEERGCAGASAGRGKMMDSRPVR